jgi:NADH-quinone oxidoreductase subunit N
VAPLRANALVYRRVPCYFAGPVTDSAAIGLPFIPSAGDLRPFAAEICLVAGIAGNLMTPFLVRKPNLSCAMVTLASLLIGVVFLLSGGTHPEIMGERLRGLLVFDSAAYVWKLTLLLFVAGVVVLWIGNSGRTLREGDAPEFFTLLLGATLGMCLMASSTNLLVIFMSIAMASLPSYMLAGFRKINRLGSEASLKYVLFGAVTAAVMAYGMSFLYGVYGTLQLQPLGILAGHSAVLSVALLGILIGIGFKVSAVPLHWWVPDVFEGATIEVATFLSVASKGAGLVLMLRILQTTGTTPAITVTLGLLGAITATVGNTGAFAQSSMKRLLAYSSVAQSGYMLCAVALMTANPNAGGSAAGAVLLYLVVYAVMNLGAFAVTASVLRQTGSDSIDGFRGLAKTSPILAGSMLCCLISLIGLPPLAGFGAKVIVLWVLAQAGSFGLFLVAVIVANTVLSAFYYFRVVRAMYFDPGDEVRQSSDPILGLLAGGCAAALVVCFFLFGPLYAMAARNDHLGTASPVAAATQRGANGNG